MKEPKYKVGTKLDHNTYGPAHIAAIFQVWNPKHEEYYPDWVYLIDFEDSADFIDESKVPAHMYQEDAFISPEWFTFAESSIESNFTFPDNETTRNT